MGIGVECLIPFNMQKTSQIREWNFYLCHYRLSHLTQIGINTLHRTGISLDLWYLFAFWMFTLSKNVSVQVHVHLQYYTNCSILLHQMPYNFLLHSKYSCSLLELDCWYLWWVAPITNLLILLSFSAVNSNPQHCSQQSSSTDNCGGFLL